ncbi:MAG: hypothetical protein IKH15_09375 [Bacteroidales bacterium]|nr:hypothetical protein [Bacteroidales bacterium]
MYISPMQEKLMEIIGENPIDKVRDFMVMHGANRNEMTDAYHLALWIEGAPAPVKEEFIEKFNEDDWPTMRVCDFCGCFMDEGYLLDTRYACSDACAIALFDGDEAALREAIGDGEGDFFWTQWY